LNCAAEAAILIGVSEHAMRGTLRHTFQGALWSAAGSSSLLWALVVAVSYFVIAKGALTLASVHPNASPVWPPTGLALASFLLWGNGLWPAIAAGAFLVSVTTAGSLFTSSMIAGGNTFEGLITASLLKRWTTSDNAFETPLEVVLFAGLALAPGTMVSATVGVGSLVIAGFAEPTKFFSIWLTWWLGDVGGQLLVTPFIVLWFKSRFSEMGRVELQRLAVLLAATIIVGFVAFSPLIQQTSVTRIFCISGRSAPLVVRVAARSAGHGNGCVRAVCVRDLGDAIRWRSFRKDQFERLLSAGDGIRDQCNGTEPGAER
jgi:integral membrane sensor domain MASE1